MPTHLLFDISGPGSVVLLIFLGFLALIVVNLLIALVEGVALTLINWNPFRQSMTVSAIMNLASGIINGVLLILLQHSPLVWLLLSFVVSVFIEGFILTYFKRNVRWQNFFLAVILNLFSYLILILPAYYFGTHR
jgi:hypothetical protein